MPVEGIDSDVYVTCGCPDLFIAVYELILQMMLARVTVVSVYDELERLLDTGSWGELVPYLHAPATSQTGKETRAGYRSRRAHWTGEVHYPDFDLAACLRALAVALAKPEQAARWLSKPVWPSCPPARPLPSPRPNCTRWQRRR
jgi:hypothetical protein